MSKMTNIQVFCGTSKIYPRHFIFRQYITTTSVQVLHTLPIKSKMMKKNHCHQPTLTFIVIVLRTVSLNIRPNRKCIISVAVVGGSGFVITRLLLSSYEYICVITRRVLKTSYCPNLLRVSLIINVDLKCKHELG